MKNKFKKSLIALACMMFTVCLTAVGILYASAESEANNLPGTEISADGKTLTVTDDFTMFTYLDSSIEKIIIESDVLFLNAHTLSTAKNCKEYEILSTGSNGSWTVGNGVLYQCEVSGQGYVESFDPAHYKLFSYPSGKTEESFVANAEVRVIGEYSISNQNLNSVDFSSCESLSSINDYAFFGMDKSQAEFKFPEVLSQDQIDNPTIFGGWDGSKTTLVEGEMVFSDDGLVKDTDGLMSATVNFNPSNYYFQDSSVERVYIEKDVTALRASMFATALNLQEIAVDNQNSTYVSVDGVLYEKDSSGEPVKLIFYPAGKTDLTFTTPSTVKSIGQYGIARQRNLTELTLTEGITRLEANAFFNSTSITKWQFPTTIASGQYTSAVFSGGTTVNYLKISDTETLKGIVKSRAFYRQLETLEFLDGVTELGWQSLKVDTNLQNIIIPKTVTSIEFYYTTTNYDGSLTDNRTFTDSTYFKNLKTIQVAEDNTVYASDGIGIWEKATGTLRATASANTTPFGGTKQFYWETPDEVKKIATHSLTVNVIQELKIGKNVTEIENGAIINMGTALRAISVDQANQNFTSYDGVLFSKDMTRLIKYPASHVRTNIFEGSATYAPTKLESERYGITDNTTRYFSNCYMIPKTVKNVDALAFADTGSYDDDYGTPNFYIYLPSFVYDTTKAEEANYINDNVIDFDEDCGIDLGSSYIYFPQSNYDFYMYEYDGNNQQVKDSGGAGIPSQFAINLGFAKQKDWNDPTQGYVFNERNLYSAEKYSTSMVAGEGDPFVIRYSEYGTSGYVKPAA